MVLCRDLNLIKKKLNSKRCNNITFDLHLNYNYTVNNKQ